LFTELLIIFYFEISSFILVEELNDELDKEREVLVVDYLMKSSSKLRSYSFYHFIIYNLIIKVHLGDENTEIYSIFLLEF